MIKRQLGNQGDAYKNSTKSMENRHSDLISDINALKGVFETFGARFSKVETVLHSMDADNDTKLRALDEKLCIYDNELTKLAGSIDTQQKDLELVKEDHEAT